MEAMLLPDVHPLPAGQYKIPHSETGNSSKYIMITEMGRWAYLHQLLKGKGQSARCKGLAWLTSPARHWAFFPGTDHLSNGVLNAGDMWAPYLRSTSTGESLWRQVCALQQRFWAPRIYPSCLASIKVRSMAGKIEVHAAPRELQGMLSTAKQDSSGRIDAFSRHRLNIDELPES